MYGIPDKYIKVISAMYENNTAAVKVGNEFSSWFCIKSGVRQGLVLSPFIWIILINFTWKGAEERQWKTMESNGDEKLSWI